MQPVHPVYIYKFLDCISQVLRVGYMTCKQTLYDRVENVALMIGLHTLLIMIFVLHELVAIYNNGLTWTHPSSTLWKGRVVDCNSQGYDDFILWCACRLDDGSICASDCVVDRCEYQRKVKCGGWISGKEMTVGYSKGVFALDILSASRISIRVESRWDL